MILSVFFIAGVSASDNITVDDANTTALIKETPKITIDSSNVYTGKSIEISLKDSNDTFISNQNLTITKMF